MYACICNRVSEDEVHTAIRCGAHDLEQIGDACEAGTNCFTCHDRLREIIEEHFSFAV
ncbi:MAG: (2Fe-2S)-binding protein [Catenulispora sp.]|nr:(2Fe-2S)-binding protein [Catenulispora sp.]